MSKHKMKEFWNFYLWDRNSSNNISKEGNNENSSKCNNDYENKDNQIKNQIAIPVIILITAIAIIVVITMKRTKDNDNKSIMIMKTGSSCYEEEISSM